MGLFDLFKKEKSRPAPLENLDRLTPEGDLPYGWCYKYRDFIDDATEEYKFFDGQYCDNIHGHPKKKYAALKSLLKYIEDAKKKYAEMGECFLFWFEVMWATEEGVKQLNEELSNLENNMDKLIEEYERKQYIINILVPAIKEKAIKIIKENPGILQTDIYSYFKPEEKTYVQRTLYYMDADGTIKREKHGNTYTLKL